MACLPLPASRVSGWCCHCRSGKATPLLRASQSSSKTASGQQTSSQDVSLRRTPLEQPASPDSLQAGSLWLLDCALMPSPTLRLRAQCGLLTFGAQRPSQTDMRRWLYQALHGRHWPQANLPVDFHFGISSMPTMTAALLCRSKMS